ncbi:hypothetical protein D3C72_1697820 [compost metagenome]
MTIFFTSAACAAKAISAVAMAIANFGMRRRCIMFFLWFDGKGKENAGSAEREGIGLHAGVEEADGKGSRFDGAGLADELVKTG